MDQQWYSAVRVTACVGCVVAFAAWSCRAPQGVDLAPIPRSARPPSPPAPLPVGPAVFAANTEITALAPEGEDALWAGTTGGVLRYAAGRWRHFTWLDGLPSHEARSVPSQPGRGVAVEFPGARALWQGKEWQIQQTQSSTISGTVATRWRGQNFTAELDTLKVTGAGGTVEVPLPSVSEGTHITALMPTTKALTVAIYGDGLWDWDGKKWSRAGRWPVPPPGAREITAAALSPAGKTLWMGTRRNGIFRCQNGRWEAMALPLAPASHNAQYLALYQGDLWLSSLDDGVAARTSRGWAQATAPQLSSNAVRQWAVCRGALYLRHGDGQVDKFQDGRWQRDVFPFLPRKKALCMATDGQTLYLGQWGGWSAWDGQRWTHQFEVPEIKNVPLQGLACEPGALWLLTQSRGLLRIDLKTGAVQVHDERHGLPDDWATAVLTTGGQTYAGTFVGGLARLVDGKWQDYEALRGQNVTALEADGKGGAWVGTRHGLWHVQGANLRRVRPLPPDVAPPKNAVHAAAATLLERNVLGPGAEVQALLRQGNGLWIGTRTGLAFVPVELLG